MVAASPGIASAFGDLRIPLLQAPMFLVSSARLARACSASGVIGAFQLANPGSADELAEWLDAMTRESRSRRASGRPFAPWCVNINAGGLGQEGYRERVDSCERARVPLVLSSTGDPTPLVPRVHAWGGRVIHDVTTLRFAEKAIAAGVDGLMLNCAGAGGHTGALSPFAFLPQVRARFDGLIVLAGGIADASGIRGALALGADLVCMGTRFVATEESEAPADYKRMLVGSGSADVVETDAIAGLTANWLRPSIEAQGLDPGDLPRPTGLHRPDLPKGVRAWRNVWSAGHSVGLVGDVPPVATLVERLATDLAQDLAPGWQDGIVRRLGLAD